MNTGTSVRTGEQENQCGLGSRRGELGDGGRSMMRKRMVRVRE